MCRFIGEVGPKRNPTRGASSKKASSSRAQQTPPPPADYDTNLFVNKQAADMFKKIHEKFVVRERGFEFQDEPFENNPAYDLIWAEIVRRNWGVFCNSTRVGMANYSQMFEFYANFPHLDVENHNFIRGKKVPTEIYSFNSLLHLPTLSALDDEH